MDVCVEVIKSFRIKDNRFSVKVAWWNLGCEGKPSKINIIERFEIKDSTQWVNITNELYKVRTVPGLPK